jgi:Arc/MetJ family transcription regulator
VRTTVDIDDELMNRAMRVSGASTKRAVVQHALELIVRVAEEQEKLLRSARGKFHWEGDLAAMRRDPLPRQIRISKKIKEKLERDGG